PTPTPTPKRSPGTPVPPASTPPPRQAVPKVQLPAELQPGGRVESVLDSAQDQVSDRRGRELLRRLRESLDSERSSRRQRHAFGWYTDPVLDYCLGRLLDEHSCRGGEWQYAVDAYFASMNPYDLILGELIPEELAEDGRNKVYAAGRNPTVAEDLPFFLAKLDHDRGRERPLGLPTGLSSLDAIFGGVSGLTVVGAGPDVDKTEFALQVATAALKAAPDLAVCFFTLKKNKGDVLRSLVCRHAGVALAELLAANRTTEDDLAAIGEDHSKVFSRIRVIDKPFLKREWERSPDKHGEDFQTSMFEIDDLRKHGQALFSHVGAEGILVVVDEFQDVPVVDSKEEDSLRLEMFRAFLAWAGPASHVLCTSGVRKESRETELRIQDLTGSAKIGDAADNILLMRRKGKSKRDVVEISARVAKSSHGGVDREAVIQFDEAMRRYQTSSSKATARKPRRKNGTSPDPYAGSDGP
ncbi:MAG: DnaB helicase C-terminal domain-containing protein, partial [Planctomycetales bacterium]